MHPYVGEVHSPQGVHEKPIAALGGWRNLEGERIPKLIPGLLEGMHRGPSEVKEIPNPQMELENTSDQKHVWGPQEVHAQGL